MLAPTKRSWRCRPPHVTQRFDGIPEYKDLPEISLQQIEHFFAHYKDLEPGKWVRIRRWGDAAEAKQLILEGVARAEKKLRVRPKAARALIQSCN